MSGKIGSFIAPTSSRKSSGWHRKVMMGLSALIIIYHIYTFYIGAYSLFPHRSIHLQSLLVICFLTLMPSSRPSRFLEMLNCLFVAAAVVVMSYYLYFWENFEYVQPWQDMLSGRDIFFGGILMVLLLEAARRSMGLPLPLLTVFFIFYWRFGNIFPGVFYHSGYSVARIAEFSAFGVDGIFGIPIGVSSTYIILFVLFGALALKAGAGQFVNDLSMHLAGRTRGGPAKVAIIASGLIGSITGSSSANVAITGSFTIPMMKKIGFQPHIAGAVEAVASTGGHITPPIMASVIFIMCELIEVPYMMVVVVAIIPAILYYFGIWVQVHFYAVRHNIRAGDEERGSLGEILKRGWVFYIPFALLVGILIAGYSPIRAGLFALPATVICSWLRKETRMGVKEILEAFYDAVMTARVIMLATALIGIIMGAIFSTGMAGVVASVISSWTSGHMLFLSLLVAAGMSLIIGMAAAILPAYILTALLLIPAITELGIPPIAAHLFAIYLASISVVTPPVGGTFYVAAGIAGAEPFKVGFAAMRLAFAGFIIPFFFVYHPALLLIGSPLEIIKTVIFAFSSIFLLGSGMEGWLLTRQNMLERLGMITGGFLLLFIQFIPTVAALFIFFGVLAWQWRKSRGMKPPGTTQKAAFTNKAINI
ncbi:MAG: TRAP transporter fused permease subunit [Desulfobacterales bacterium]|nr:TRAP transporter fused permease subunit [Desulfobacterales bacterium]